MTMFNGFVVNPALAPRTNAGDNVVRWTISGCVAPSG